MAISVARPTCGGYPAMVRLRQLLFSWSSPYLYGHRVPPQAGLVALRLAPPSGLGLLASHHGTSLAGGYLDFRDDDEGGGPVSARFLAAFRCRFAALTAFHSSSTANGFTR